MSGDVPIEPPDDDRPHVQNVIDLAGVRIQWGAAAHRRRGDICEHKALNYSPSERRIWCTGCERTIDNFDGFMTLVRHFQEMERAARHKNAEADAAIKSVVRRRATKELDRAWSGSLCAVACVHCGGGLLPEDFENGARSRTSRELELQRRRRNAASPPHPDGGSDA